MKIIRGAVSVVQSDLGHFFEYDRLMFAVGKSGIDFGKQLADDYKLPTEPKPVQLVCDLKHHKNTSKN